MNPAAADLTVALVKNMQPDVRKLVEGLLLDGESIFTIRRRYKLKRRTRRDDRSMPCTGYNCAMTTCLASALKRSAVLGSVLALSYVAHAQSNPDAKAILQRVSEAYVNLKRYEFTLRITLEEVTKAGEKQLDTKTFKFAVQRPDRIRLEYQDDNLLFGTPIRTGGPTGPMLIIGDGKSVWMYAPELKIYGRVTSKVNEDAAALVGNPTNWVTRMEQAVFSNVQSALAQADPLQPVGEEPIVLDGKKVDCYVIVANPGVYKMWVDKRNYLIVREVGREADLLATTEFFVNRIGTQVPADLFVFTPPPDAKEQEMDMRRNPFQ